MLDMRLHSAQQDVAMLERGAVMPWIEPQPTTIASSFLGILSYYGTVLMVPSEYAYIVVRQLFSGGILLVAEAILSRF